MLGTAQLALSFSSLISVDEAALEWTALIAHDIKGELCLGALFCFEGLGFLTEL